MNKIEVFSFEDKYAEEFKNLNVEWLHKYFEIEPHDIEMLSDAKSYIIDKGGEILFVKYNNQIVGTVALIKINNNEAELAKMAVTEKFKGLKIGNLLMKKVIETAKQMRFKTLILESNKKLKPAIHLYRKYGFVEIETDKNSPYKRANIRMVKLLNEGE
ncbi:MAG: GNAT family N-acetyltransferase [Lutibacter sp.]